MLPKLREENARAKAGKGGKKKGWKDVVVEGLYDTSWEIGHRGSWKSCGAKHFPDDFEVSVFLTEVSTRHTILRKDKRAREKREPPGTNGGKLTGSGTMDVPVEITDEWGADLVREESQEGKALNLEDIPIAEGENEENISNQERAEEEELFISDGPVGQYSETNKTSRSMQAKPLATSIGSDINEDDKKKMALTTTYDGFSIYGRILCLVVKRRGVAKGKEPTGGSGQAMMEEWIASTQIGEGPMMDD